MGFTLITVDAQKSFMKIVGAGALVYFSLLFVMKGIGQAELVLVKRLLRIMHD